MLASKPKVKVSNAYWV